MTPDEQRRIDAYIRHLADRVGLRDWAVYTNDESPAGGEHGEYAATITRTYGRKDAAISLGVGWQAWPPGSLRQTIVHELIHLHLGAVQDAAKMAALQSMGAAAYSVWSHMFEHLLEFGVDAIADVVAPHLPLPNADAAKKKAAEDEAA